MKVVIIYHDFASAARANSALQRSGQFPDIEVEWNMRPWRLDMLRFPPIASEALLDALDAHLLVFAGSVAQTIPFWLQDWLEDWASQRHIARAALAVLGAERSEFAKTSGVADLQEFARIHGLEVVFDERTSVPADSPLLDGSLLPPNTALSNLIRPYLNH